MATLLERPLRGAILAAAGNRRVQRFVERYGMRMGARRFVAGERLGDFLRVAEELNARGLAVACGILGEGVANRAEANAVTQRYCELLELFGERGLHANVAFKLTHVGLDIDPELAFENARRICKSAEDASNTMRIDMEQSRHADATLSIWRRLRERSRAPGFVLQSCLYRSVEDLRAAIPLEPNVRIVKGAYLEPPSVAFERKRDVDAAYVAMCEIALSHPGYTAIATHDPRIIERVQAFCSANGVPKERFEFQMLFGIGMPLAQRLVDCGYRVRLAVPFGDRWFPYLMRRLAERPANLAFFLKGALLAR